MFGNSRFFRLVILGGFRRVMMFLFEYVVWEKWVVIILVGSFVDRCLVMLVIVKFFGNVMFWKVLVGGVCSTFMMLFMLFCGCIV